MYWASKGQPYRKVGAAKSRAYGEFARAVGLPKGLLYTISEGVVLNDARQHVPIGSASARGTV